MNLSFSTRGWPDLTWTEMLETACDMGFSGVEVYNLPKFTSLTESDGPFHKYRTAATVRQLRELNLEIPCFDSSWNISQADCNLEDLYTLMQVAHDARVSCVVCCGWKRRASYFFLLINDLVQRA